METKINLGCHGCIYTPVSKDCTCRSKFIKPRYFAIHQSMKRKKKLKSYASTKK